MSDLSAEFSQVLLLKHDIYTVQASSHPSIPTTLQSTYLVYLLALETFSTDSRVMHLKSQNTTICMAYLVFDACSVYIYIYSMKFGRNSKPLRQDGQLPMHMATTSPPIPMLPLPLPLPIDRQRPVCFSSQAFHRNSETHPMQAC